MSQASSEQLLYRVIFSQEDKIYQIYSRYLSEDSMVGFIDVEELVFSQEKGLLIDPSEEKLQAEFQGVRRIYIPLHHVLRIDEIIKQESTQLKPHCTTGASAAQTQKNAKGNVHHLQTYRTSPEGAEES